MHYTVWFFFCKKKANIQYFTSIQMQSDWLSYLFTSGYLSDQWLQVVHIIAVLAMFFCVTLNVLRKIIYKNYWMMQFSRT